MSRGKRRKSKPTSKDRSKKQNLKDRYAHAREDAQLAGIIPTTPKEALKSEKVDPSMQEDTPLWELVQQAIKEEWAVPDKAKPGILKALLAPFFNDDTVLDKDGNVVHVTPSAKKLIACANTLRMLDQMQWERDHPKEAGMAKGGVRINNTNLQANIEAAALIRQAIESGELGLLEESEPLSNGEVAKE